MNEVGCLADNW